MDVHYTSRNVGLDALAPDPQLTALVGAGGKTSLLFALAGRAAEQGHRVLATTTTRMRIPAERDGLRVVLTPSTDLTRPEPGRIVYQAEPPRPGDPADKVRGVPAAVLDAWREVWPDVCILVEADGAANRLLKAPAVHEPIIPSSAGTVIAVVGLGCIGKPFREDVVFRMAETTRITGLTQDASITPDAVLALAAHPEGFFKNSPGAARRVLFLNQADVPDGFRAGEHIARLIADKVPSSVHAVHIGSANREGSQWAIASMP